MTTFAKVDSIPGKVVHLYVGEQAPLDSTGEIKWYIVPDSLASQVEIGWSYDGNNFVAPVEEVSPVVTATVAPVVNTPTALGALENSLKELHDKVDTLIEHSTLAKETNAIYQRVVTDIQADVQSVPLLKRTLAGIKDVLGKL